MADNKHTTECNKTQDEFAEKRYKQTYVNGDVITRAVERHDLEAERLLSNRLNQHQITALQQTDQCAGSI